MAGDRFTHLVRERGMSPGDAARLVGLEGQRDALRSYERAAAGPVARRHYRDLARAVEIQIRDLFPDLTPQPHTP